MNDYQISGLQYFVIIADQKKRNRYIALLNEHGAHGVQTVYGHGSASPSPLAAAFGFNKGQNKVLIASLIKTEEARKLIDKLYNDYKFNKPNTGIAYCISVDGIAF